MKELRAVLAKPGLKRGAGRDPDLVGLEGQHLVEEALRSGIEVRTIFVRAGEEALLEAMFARLESSGFAASSGRPGPHPEPEFLSVPADILRAAVTTEAPQSLAALAVPPAFTLDSVLTSLDAHANHEADANLPPTRHLDAFHKGPTVPSARAAAPLLLVLAGLQDPGNVGTILRSAEAFGASGILTLPGTANLWNPKSLRASMGSAFRLPVVSATPDQAFTALHAQHVRSLAAVAPAHPRAQQLASLDLTQPIAIWIGNEGSGLPPELIARCDAAITIPCPGPVESLNAAIAASVLLYEAFRQRPASSTRNQHPKPA